MMEEWPSFTEHTSEINKFWEISNKYREEKKLYKFLNGLDASLGPVRSQLLLRNPLPRVEEAVSVLQHEEIQKQVLEGANKMEIDQSAFYNNNTIEYNNNCSRNDNSNKKECVIYKKKGHTKDECWWNKDIPNNPGPPPKKGNQTTNNKWNNNKGKKTWHKSARNAAANEDSRSGSNPIMMTQEQLRAVLKSHSDKNPLSNEELEAHFAGLLDPED